MQELRNQYTLMLQLVRGLESQISSKTRENRTLFNQYERLSAENSNLITTIDSLKSKEKQLQLCQANCLALHNQVLLLKQIKTSLQNNIEELLEHVHQKETNIILLESQLLSLTANQVNFAKQSTNQSNKPQASQNGNHLNGKINETFGMISLEKQNYLKQKIKQNAQLRQKILSLEENQRKDAQNQVELKSHISELKLVLNTKQLLLAQFSQFLSKLNQKSHQAVEKYLELKSSLKEALRKMIAKQQDRGHIKESQVQISQKSTSSNVDPIKFTFLPRQLQLLEPNQQQIQSQKQVMPNQFENQCSFLEISQQKERYFNEKAEQLRNSFQTGGNFQFYAIEKNSLQKATQARSQEIDNAQELKKENNSLKELIEELQERILILQEQDKSKNSFLKQEVQMLQKALKQNINLALIQLNQKNEIISELEETVLRLEKSFNSEIMQLKKHNAQLRGQILNLNKKLFLLDPNAINIVDFVKDTCKYTINETQFYKSQYNYKNPSHFSQREKSCITNYLTQKDLGQRNDHHFTQKDLNLGERMMGRHCRAKFTLSSDFKQNKQIWQLNGSRPL